ncbi:MAG TPA: hypothetical protein VNO70_09490 [Blastocatellia bacterium]|nr:hypothetical protein [Blastocatellia bacterium]
MRSTGADNKVHIGNVIRNAVVFNFKNWQEGGVSADNLLETVARLFALLKERQIDYLLVGGIALLQYVEGRNTEDIDLIMAVSSLEKLPEIQILDQNPDFARGKFQELQIDILLTSNPLFDKVRRQYAAPQSFVEQEIPCATVEGLLLLKMYALPSLYRQGNFARVGLYENDIATLIQAYKPQMAPLLNELSHHLSATDLGAIRDIVDEIQERIHRFERSLGDRK